LPVADLSSIIDQPDLGLAVTDFAVVQGKVLIVNPSDRKIADIITS
jgi:hypothetical protein